MMRLGINYILVFCLAWGLSGCSTINSQISGRTATEQYLVTEAIDRALNQVRWANLRGHRVFIRVIGVQNTEYDYMTDALRNQLLAVSAVPVPDVTMASTILTAHIKSVGTDIWTSNFGIPVFVTTHPDVPSSAAGLSIYQSNLQEGYCRIAFSGTDPRNERLSWQVPEVHGRTYFKTTTFLMVFGPFKSSDIFPERKLIRPKGYIPIPKATEEEKRN